MKSIKKEASINTAKPLQGKRRYDGFPLEESSPELFLFAKHIHGFLLNV